MDGMKSDVRSRFWLKFGIQFILGGIAGAAAVLLLGRWIRETDFGNAHELGLLIGALLVYMGLSLLLAAASPARAAKLMGQELEPEEDFSAETHSLRLQAIVSLLAGVELLVLSWRTDTLTGATQAVLLAGLVVLVLLQSWLNYRVWRRGDEFFRRILVEAAVISFVIAQFLLFAWAVLTRFDLVNEPSVLDIYVIVMTIYLLASFVAGMRRGLGVPDR